MPLKKVFAGVLVLALVCPASSLALRGKALAAGGPSAGKAVSLRGGVLRRLQMCGQRRTVVVAAERTPVYALVPLSARQRRLLVQRCENGTWKAFSTVRPESSRQVLRSLDTTAAGDYRVSVRGARPAYLRVGVGEIADMAVSFTVDNVNRSLVPCPTDGARYTLSGHIVGPVAAMRDGAAATLYLHGAAVPEATWRMPVAGYDYGFEQARLGHVSVTVDRLSYGKSPTPNGLLTCFGGQADMAHQIVTELRSGDYVSPDPVRFARVALAGHSAGQLVAEIEAYSFADVDAIVVGGWGDPAPTFEDGLVLLPSIETCAAGGEPKRPGEPGFYAFSFKGMVPKLLFYNAEVAVIAAYVARHERDACDASIVSASAINALLVSQVHVPVFLFYGLNDALWPAGTGKRQRGLFTGSNDVTLFELRDTGHMMMLGRTAPAFRTELSRWLRQHGF